MSMPLRPLAASLLMSSVLCTVPAASQAAARQMPWEEKAPPRLIEDRFRVDVGYWLAGISTELRADATPEQPGTQLSGESDLGFSDSQQLPEFELTLIPAKHHLLRLHAFSTRRNGRATVEESIEYDGTTYNVGEVLNSTLNLRFVGLTYGYRFIATPRYELTATASVQVASMEANVITIPRTATREPDQVNAPLAQLGLEARWEVLRHWALLGRYQWLSAKFNNDTSEGSYIDWRAGVQWQASQHLGIGVFYRHFELNADVASGSHPGLVNLTYKGPVASLRASF